MVDESLAFDVRPAHRSDVGELSRVLSRAFYGDPESRWEVPDDTVRRDKLHHLWTALIRHHHLAGGGIEVGVGEGKIVAGSVWDPPGRWHFKRHEEVLVLARLLWAFGTNLSRSNAFIEATQEHHPSEPHWYLAIIGSEPALRGKGFGHALMRSRLDRCDAEHLPAYLESTNPANLPYYERFGFEVTGEIKLPFDGPSIWSMWRQVT